MHRITDNYTASGQIAVDDVAAIAEAGFKAVVCNRPDHEDPGQPTAADVAAACEQHGLAFHHVPFVGSYLTLDIVESMREVMSNTDGPVFAYCRSGTRSAFVWQYASQGA